MITIARLPTLHSIRMRVSELACRAQVAPDPEAHRSDEDDLHQDVLDWIANGQLSGQDARDAAGMAMTTRQIAFPRWYT